MLASAARHVRTALAAVVVTAAATGCCCDPGVCLLPLFTILSTEGLVGAHGAPPEAALAAAPVGERVSAMPY